MLDQHTNKIRLRLHIPEIYWEEPVISRLVSNFGLVVNITGAFLGEQTSGNGCFDVELCGNVSQIERGLNYLKSLNLVIKGKANSAGDAWQY